SSTTRPVSAATGSRRPRAPTSSAPSPGSGGSTSSASVGLAAAVVRQSACLLLRCRFSSLHVTPAALPPRRLCPDLSRLLRDDLAPPPHHARGERFRRLGRGQLSPPARREAPARVPRLGQ